MHRADRPSDARGMMLRRMDLPSGSARRRVPSGTRGIVQEIGPARAEGRIYRVRFLASERHTEEEAWLADTDLLGP
jgi:hypothetical protein